MPRLIGAGVSWRPIQVIRGSTLEGLLTSELVIRMRSSNWAPDYRTEYPGEPFDCN